MDKPLAELRTARVTNAAGADVLPAFSRDGRWMMWTGQRGPMVEGETRPSSQVWVARFEGDPFEEGAAGDGPAGEQADSR
jgi:hypothetical protein